MSQALGFWCYGTLFSINSMSIVQLRALDVDFKTSFSWKFNYLFEQGPLNREGQRSLRIHNGAIWTVQRFGELNSLTCTRMQKIWGVPQLVWKLCFPLTIVSNGPLWEFCQAGQWNRYFWGRVQRDPKRGLTQNRSGQEYAFFGPEFIRLEGSREKHAGHIVVVKVEVETCEFKKKWKTCLKWKFSFPYNWQANFQRAEFLAPVKQTKLLQVLRRSSGGLAFFSWFPIYAYG